MRQASPFIIRLFFGLFRPNKTILGYVLAGEIDATGKSVKTYKPGDQLYATTGMNFAAYAEYICLAEDAVIDIKPQNVNYKQAAAIPFGGNTALYFLRKAQTQPGQTIPVYGASGAVGTAAVQLAKYFGAEVTAVCSEKNFQLLKSLGADKLIDYLQQDFSHKTELYDVIFDTVGKARYSDCIRVLAADGYLLLAAAGIGEMIQGLYKTLTSDQTVIYGVVQETADDLKFLTQLIEQGKYKEVIDKCYALEDMAAAHRYVKTGHKTGNVIITID